MRRLLFLPLLFACYTISTAQTLQENFKRNVSTLASDRFEGREASTPADTLSAKYIAAEFAKIKGVQLLGDNGLQQVVYKDKKSIQSASMKVGRKALTLNESFIPAVASTSGDFSGETIFLGFGAADDYTNQSLEGKYILVTEGVKKGTKSMSINDKALLAIKANAAGLIVIEDAKKVSKKDVTRPTLTPASDKSLFIAKVNSKVGAQLKKGASFTASVQTHMAEKHTHNVVARLNALKENNPDGKTVVIGAHYDHMGYEMIDGEKVICRGADDNASGIATIIEFARRYAQLVPAMQRDIIFIAFGAEEKGLKGSAYYASNPLDSLSNCVGMVNFDMTGRMRAKGITIRGLGSAHQAIPMFSLLPNKDELDIVWEMRGAGPTDYSSFYKKGVPAFSFSTRLHPDYHTPRDTEEEVNYEGMEMMFNYVTNLINRLVIETVQLTVKPDRQ